MIEHSRTMIDHSRWLELAVVRPAFALMPSESVELGAHLSGCPACARQAALVRADAAAIAGLDFGPLPVPVRGSILRAVHSRERLEGARATLVALAALALLAVVMAAGSLGVGAILFQGQSAPPFGGTKAIVWQTEVVRLRADDFWIDANGLRFTGDQLSLDVGSDPGDRTYWTLELEWREHAQEQRLYLYFAADGATWWISEVRVYDGVAAPSSEWASLPPGPYARTPLGTAWAGSLDLAGVGRSGPVRLHLGGVVLGVTPRDPFAVPPGGPIKLAGELANPFGPRGGLRCSGILQMSPPDAERILRGLGYVLSWRYQYETGPNTGYAEVRADAPASGFISGTAVGSDGELIVFVEDPARPSRPAATFPPGCPSPPSG